MARTNKNNNKNNKRQLSRSKKKKHIHKNKHKSNVKRKTFQKGGAFYVDFLKGQRNIFESFLDSSQIRKNKLEVIPSDTQKFYSKGEKSDENYKDNALLGIRNFTAVRKAEVLTFLSMHGKYFTNKISGGFLDYFIVPSNVIICIITPPDSYSVSYTIKQPYYMMKDKVFEMMTKYRSNLKEETFFFGKSEGIQVDLYDYFKFSNWFYPGQLCHNFNLSLSDREYKHRKKENFDLFKPVDGPVRSGTWIVNTICQNFYQPGQGISFDAQSIIHSLNPSYKYYILIESCNMTNINRYESVMKYGDHLYGMHHLNQSVVRQVEEEMGTEKPTLEETINFKYQGVRHPLQSLFRHSMNDIFDAGGPHRLFDFIDQETTKKKHYMRNYKIELYYEIIIKLQTLSYADVTDMQPYFDFLKNLSVTEMLNFIKLLAKLTNTGSGGQEISRENLLFMIRSVFGNNYFLDETSKKIKQVFQVIRALNNIENVSHIRNVEDKKKSLSAILSHCVQDALHVQDYLNQITATQEIDLSSLRGVLDTLNMRDVNKFKYVIQNNQLVGAAALELLYSVDIQLISTLLIKSCVSLPKKEGQIDLQQYKFDSLEITNCETENFDDSGIRYNLEYFRTHSFECLVQNSIFKASPRCSILKQISNLFITRIPLQQTKLKIGHFFHNLNKFTVEVSSHIQLVALENNKVEILQMNSRVSEPVSPHIHIRSVNLKTIVIKNVGLQNLILHNCRNLTSLSLEFLELGTGRTNQLLNFIPRLKKLHLKHCQFTDGDPATNKLEIPPRLEDILIHNFKNGNIDFSKTTLDGLKRASLLFVKMSVEDIFTAKDKFSREKLDYLYIILDNMDKPELEQRQKFYELEDYLESIGSRVIQRTHTDSEYEKIFH